LLEFTARGFNLRTRREVEPIAGRASEMRALQELLNHDGMSAALAVLSTGEHSGN
jgi:hypothetical protein